MRQAKISGMVRRKRGRTTISVPGVRVADDLVERQFRPAGTNQLWVADVTYLRTWEGWLYLAAVQDAYSRRIVGWSMAEHMRSELVVDAPRDGRRSPPTPTRFDSPQRPGIAIRIPGPRPGCPRGRDRWLDRNTKGDCYDNAVAESFFATLKKELVHRRSWPTRRELATEVFDYIETFYNRVRRHSTLGMLAPLQFDNSTRLPDGAQLRRFAAQVIQQSEIINT